MRQASLAEGITGGYIEEIVLKEAKRCLRCDVNPTCAVGEDKCQGVAAFLHRGKGENFRAFQVKEVVFKLRRV